MSVRQPFSNRVLILSMFCLNVLPSLGQIGPIRPFQQQHALIVGISDYQHENIPDLQFAHLDALALDNFLRQESGWNTAEEHIHKLINENATYGAFLNALQAIEESCREGDRLLLYFSGHGDIEKTPSSPMGYLLMYDATPSAYAGGGACSVATLHAFLEKLVLKKGVELILVTDACRSGKLAGSDYQGTRLTTGALAELFSNTTRILSCEPDQFSVEGENWGGGRGLFSYFLLEGLGGEADEDGNRYIEFRELEPFIKKQVWEASGHTQRPMTMAARSSIRLSKVSQSYSKGTASFSKTADRDTSGLQLLNTFNQAITEGRLLDPKDNCAHQIFLSLGESPEKLPLRTILKPKLASALQDKAQQAINTYLTTPGRELSKRWANPDLYQKFPDYLAVAAKLLGAQNSFYADIKSREYYFRAVNLRLEFDLKELKSPTTDSSILLVALAYLDTALTLAGEAPHLQNELGLVYKRMGERKQEIAAFEKAYALSPTWGLALTNLATSYKDVERYPEAEALFQASLEVDPQLAMSHYNLGEMYMELGRIQDAITENREAIHLDSGFAEAYYNLGYLLMEVPGQLPAARQAIQQYISLVPEDPYGWVLYGKVQLDLEDIKGAQASFEQALSITPEDLYALENLALLQINNGNFSAGIRLWKSCLEISPNEPYFLFGLMEAYFLNNEANSGLKTLEKLLETGFDDKDFLMRLPTLQGVKDKQEFKELMDRFFPN